MLYGEIKEGKWIRRVNRFIGEVMMDDSVEKVHIRNTGRLKELLQPGATVYLETSTNPNRKTRFSLIGVHKKGSFVNVDSQAPNAIVYDGLLKGKIKELPDITFAKREAVFGDSRFDLYFKTLDKEGFIEVKGVTLEKEGRALFPDAPTTRGTKHVLEMTEAVHKGYIGVIFFLVQIKGCSVFSANRDLDPNFADALKKAKDGGVLIIAYETALTEKGFEIGKSLQVQI